MDFTSNRDELSVAKHRKKKKSFLQRAKKFGKSGRFGKGKEIDRETYDYFLRVFEQLNHGFESDDDSKHVFVTNVFETTLNEEVSLCSNQLVSRVIERLLPLSTNDVRTRFMRCLADDLRIVAVDPFSSHVLETLLLLATFEKSDLKSANKNNEYISFRRTWVLRVSKFMINNIEEFSNDCYASHLVRTCFQCLGGIRIDDNITRSRKSRNQQGDYGNIGQKKKVEATELNESQIASTLETNILHEPLILALNKILASNALEMTSYETSSAVIQSLILVLNKISLTKDCKQLCEFLLDNVFKGKMLTTSKDDTNNDTLTEDKENVLQYESSCRLLETIILVSESIPKVFKKCKKILDGNLYDWAIHPIGNFALQKFLDVCDDKELIEKWYESFFDNNLEEILAAGNSGVILSLARVVRRLSVKQAHFLVAVMKSLHCYEPPQHQLKFVTLLAYLSTRESYEETKGSPETPQLSVSLHGSLIIQELLNFNKPIKVVNSLLDMDANELKVLLSDPRGCHITDSFMQSTTIGEKSRDGLIKLMQPHLASLACSKHGSRSIDKMWEKASQKGQEIMAHELASKLTLLSNNNSGRFIAQNLCLDVYKRSKDEWKAHLKNQEKRKTLAKEFLSGLSSNKRPAEEKDCGENKKLKVKDEDDLRKESNFVIDTVGNHGNEQNPVPVPNSADVRIKEKKKKHKVKSYLDDL